VTALLGARTDIHVGPTTSTLRAPLGPEKGKLMSHRLIRIYRSALRRARSGPEDRGMTTAEYAVGIMAACTFALVLLGVVKSDAVRSALAGIVQSALGIAG